MASESGAGRGEGLGGSPAIGWQWRPLLAPRRAQEVPAQGTWGFGLDGGGLEGTSGQKEETWVWWGIPRAWKGLVLLWESTGPSMMVKNTTHHTYLPDQQHWPQVSPVPTWSGEPPGQPTEREERACPSPSLPAHPPGGLRRALHRCRVEEGTVGLPRPLPEAVAGVGSGCLRGLTGRSRHTGLWRRTCSRGRRAQRRGPGTVPCGQCSTQPGRGAALSAAPQL